MVRRRLTNLVELVKKKEGCEISMEDIINSGVTPLTLPSGEKIVR